MKLKKGDKVKVLSGKDKGKTGNIVKVLPKTEKVIVEGVNLATNFVKKNNEKKIGGLTKVEAPISIGKLQALNEANKPSRIGFEIKDGKKIRVFKKTK